jgi:hypothetical protein
MAAEKATTSTDVQPQNIRKADRSGTEGNGLKAIESTKAEAERTKGNAGHVIEAAQEKGYHGFVADPTPNENYTFAGQAKGAPTPETNRGLKLKAAARGTLPADIPFVPGTQEQFEEQIDYKTRDDK